MARKSKSKSSDIVFEWPLNNVDLLRVEVSLFHNVYYLHIRKWVRGVHGQWQRTSTGVAIKLKDLGLLRKALRKVRKRVKSEIYQ